MGEQETELEKEDRKKNMQSGMWKRKNLKDLFQTVFLLS